jgi:hypothetical protein
MGHGLRVNPVAFIIFPMVNNRSAPGQKHGHRGKSSFFHQIIFRKQPKVTNKSNIILPGCGFLGCCFRGGPRRYFWAIFGGPGRNDYRPSERLYALSEYKLNILAVRIEFLERGRNRHGWEPHGSDFHVQRTLLMGSPQGIPPRDGLRVMG